MREREPAFPLRCKAVRLRKSLRAAQLRKVTDAKSYNEFLVSAFAQQLASGSTTLSTDSVVKFLCEHQTELGQSGNKSEIDVKRYEAELQKWIEDCRSSKESEIERMRATITAGQNALRLHS